ncbi:limbin isoform X2 [Microcaecilia unicolor]|uniref:Limbin isoform X2 n=1 Tax=Microcaecilia unicolor TaxID=1415580 RepID=A0A6P7X3K9_9AMPH|nr:limbin isoform X2 [Microcaecilia unicolor]
MHRPLLLRFLTLMLGLLNKEMISAEQHEELQRISVSSVNGITLKKCGVVTYQLGTPAATVRLLTNNTSSSPPATVFDLLLLDNVTGLRIQGSNGNQTGNGTQTFFRASLKAGGSFLVSYTAFLDTEGSQTAMILSLPAQLTFKTTSQNGTQFYSLLASFTVTTKKSKSSPHHGIHFAGFIIAFVGSFLLTCVAFSMIYRARKVEGLFPSKNVGNRYKANRDQKLEHSQVNSMDIINEDFITSDKMIDILTFEETENMLQALEDMETVHLTQADSYLEACRMLISKDVIPILLRNMAFSDSFSVHDVEGLCDAIKIQFQGTENKLQEEHERKMVALTAECNLETRKAMDIQYQREMAEKEEAADLMKNATELSVTEYRISLDKLHLLEQNQVKRLLLAKEEWEFAKAYRELAVSQRTELHNCFFDQLKETAYTKGINLEATRTLMQDYSKMQEEIEELMDLLQANKKYHLSKRFACRKYLVYTLQLCENQVCCLLNTVATQIMTLISSMERAGHVTENHAGALLDRAQTEVRSIKQKLDSALRHEKKKLHQKLITKKKQQMSQKKEQRNELISVEDTFKTTKDVGSYMTQWKTLLTSQSLDLEELIEKLDNDAAEEIKALKVNLMRKATEELKRIQNVVIMQELLKLNTPRLHLQQLLEEHNKEVALRSQQFENEASIKNAEAKNSLENTARKLNEERERNLKDQKNLRTWEQLLFAKLLCLPLSLSDEELLRIKQEFQSTFSQMDSNLALPKIEGKLMLQTYQSEWRKAELLKVEQNLSTNDALKQPKMKTQCPEDKKMDVQKNSIEDKIQIYEEAITDEDIKKVRGELLLERVHQLKARENKLGEYIASLQFHKTLKKSNTLEIHMAIINLQKLLLEEMCTSGVKTEYEQLAEAHCREIEELDRKLKLEVSQKELIQHQQRLEKIQTWTTDELVSYNEVGEAVPRTMSEVLRQALNACKRLIDLQRERLRKEELDLVLSGHLQENIEMDMFLTFHSQDLRLAAHLTRQAMAPARTLQRLLNLLLPTSSKLEILSVLDSISFKYADEVVKIDSNGEEADSCKKRMYQDLWLAVENRLRQDQISQFSEKTSPASRKKRSMLKRKNFRSEKHTDRLPRLPSVGPHDYCDTVENAASEEIHLTNTGEKVFLFIQKDPTISSLLPKKKKKRNFLNFKKSRVTHMNNEG